MFAKDELRVQTLRMVNAAIKDKDINSRTADNREGVSDEEILKILQFMVKQRRDSVQSYTAGNRPDLVEKEQKEIAIIAQFLPQMLSEAELTAIIQGAVNQCNASSIKDMGKIMTILRENHSGRYDPAQASLISKNLLGQ